MSKQWGEHAIVRPSDRDNRPKTRRPGQGTYGKAQGARARPRGIKAWPRRKEAWPRAGRPGPGAEGLAKGLKTICFTSKFSICWSLGDIGQFYFSIIFKKKKTSVLDINQFNKNNKFDLILSLIFFLPSTNMIVINKTLFLNRQILASDIHMDQSEIDTCNPQLASAVSN